MLQKNHLTDQKTINLKEKMCYEKVIILKTRNIKQVFKIIKIKIYDVFGYLIKLTGRKSAY